MIPVFVVSLPDCIDRRASIRKSLDGLQIPFEFVDAVDGRHGLDPSYEPDIDRARTEREGVKGWTLSDTQYACALSHMQVYRRIVRNCVEWALVLEDDAIPSPDLKTYIGGRYYRDAQLTQLYFNKTRVSRIGQRHLFGPYSSYLRTRVKSTSTTAYVISNRAARHIVSNGVPITREADWPKCVEDLVAEKQIRVVYPVVVEHPPLIGHSIITNYEHNPAKRRLLGIYIPPFQNVMKSWARGLRPSRLLFNLITKRVAGQQTSITPSPQEKFGHNPSGAHSCNCMLDRAK